jgi:hypothetical protein
MVHQAALLEHIVTDQRYYSEYFRVAFYGNFPAALRDKQFIVSELTFIRVAVSLCRPSTEATSGKSLEHFVKEC